MEYLEQPEPDWEVFQPYPRKASPHSFLSGDPQTSRIRIRYFRRTSDQMLVGKVWFGPDSEGPPGHAHGGGIAAALDEIMGACCFMRGLRVVTAQMTVNYRTPVPLQSVTLFEAQLVLEEGRKNRVEARLILDGKVAADSSGLFITLKAPLGISN